MAISEHFASGGRVSSHVSKVQQLQANDGAFAALTEQGATTGIGFNRQGKSQGEVAEVSLFFGVGHVTCFVWSWCFLCFFWPRNFNNSLARCFRIFGGYRIGVIRLLWVFQHLEIRPTGNIRWSRSVFFFAVFFRFFLLRILCGKSILPQNGGFLFKMVSPWHDRFHGRWCPAPFTTAPRCFNTRWNEFTRGIN